MTHHDEFRFHADDQGILDVAIRLTSSGHILLEFGKSIHWLAMTEPEAVGLALGILRKVSYAGIMQIGAEAMNEPRQ